MAAAAAGSVALGAQALGAIAFGAVAVGAFAIGRLSVRHARFGTIEIDKLILHRAEFPAPHAAGEPILRQEVPRGPVRQ